MNQLSKLINRIPGSRLLILIIIKFTRISFENSNPCLVNKRHSPSILYNLDKPPPPPPPAMSTGVLKALPSKFDIKRHSPSILYISAILAMLTSILGSLLGKLDIKDSHLVFSISRQTSRCQQAFSKPCLVNLISKDTHLVFSIYMYLLSALANPLICGGKLTTV